MIADEPADVFKHFRVLRRPDGRLWELGRGAMGVTYKAEDTNLHSIVALKVVNTFQLKSDIDRARFLREARAAAALRHPNVANVYHLSSDDQCFFYAMEFVEGETLEDFVARHGPASWALGLNIADQIARALSAAARRNLIHRDIKPANIMLVQRDEEEEDGEHRQVKLIDFGLAKSTAPSDGSGSTVRVTMAGFIGTPLYASPEQLEELELDSRTDIYSLGATLWFLLTGRPPFSGSLASVFFQHVNRPPPCEMLDAASVPPPVRALLLRMLGKAPSDRPPSAIALRREIAECIRALASTGTATQAAASLTVLPAELPLADDTALPIGATPSAPDESAAGAITTPPAQFIPIAGDTLGGIYRLDEDLDGLNFLASDQRIQPPRPVCVRLFPDGPAPWETARANLDRLQAAPHPGLVELLGYGDDRGARYVVTERLTGFTLVELLRAREGAIKPAEAFALADQAAAAVDHARIHDLPAINLDPRMLTVHFPGGESVSPRLLLADWPGFLVKAASLDSDAENVLPTWAGLDTLLPQRFAFLGSDDGSAPVPALARLVYELIGGHPPAPSGRYLPLSGLNEEANDLLRTALLTEDATFRGGREFVAALAEAAMGGRTDRPPAIRPAMRSEPITAAPASPLAPPAEAGSDTLTLESFVNPAEPADETGRPGQILEPAAAAPPPRPVRVRTRRSLRPVLLNRWSAGAVMLVTVGLGGWQGLPRQSASAPSRRRTSPSALAPKLDGGAAVEVPLVQAPASIQASPAPRPPEENLPPAPEQTASAAPVEPVNLPPTPSPTPSPTPIPARVDSQSPETSSSPAPTPAASRTPKDSPDMAARNTPPPEHSRKSAAHTASTSAPADRPSAASSNPRPKVVTREAHPAGSAATPAARRPAHYEAPPPLPGGLF